MSEKSWVDRLDSICEKERKNFDNFEDFCSKIESIGYKITYPESFKNSYW